MLFETNVPFQHFEATGNFPDKLIGIMDDKNRKWQKGFRRMKLQSRTKLLIHFVVWRKFRVEIPPDPIAMLNADENVIDELKGMSYSSNQHCKGGRGAINSDGRSLHAGK